jgi:hypothetical protein
MTRISQIRRRAAVATGIIAALAIAEPVSAAPADTPPVVPAAAVAVLPAFLAPLVSSLGPVARPLAFAKGPTVVGSVVNGGTTVCVSAGTTTCSTNAAP